MSKSLVETLEEKRNNLAFFLEGTVQTLDTALEHFGYENDPVDWEDEMLTANMEECVICNWWHRSSDLTWVERLNGGVCDQDLDEEDRDE